MEVPKTRARHGCAQKQRARHGPQLEALPGAAVVAAVVRPKGARGFHSRCLGLKEEWLRDSGLDLDESNISSGMAATVANYLH